MIMLKAFLGSLALFSCAAAQADLPTLTLPWGKWQPTVYEADPKIYHFRNVRFGANPERFSAPSFPTNLNDSLQDITQSTSCIQVDISKLKYPPGGSAHLGAPEESGKGQTEDCLFLDIYVPISAFESKTPLPVIVWIYGGAYAFGSKDQGGPLYTGQSILKASDYKAIFIAGNYRVGAFGWLAGPYMETAGQPNAGLYDQALLFEWVKRYVSQVGGDKNQIIAWGESAGGGSILHHLIREDGARAPPFSAFMVQSPGYQWAWNNSQGGQLDTIYNTFANLSGCGERDIACLRAADINTLQIANQELFDDTVTQTGLFPVGPSVDGKWIKTIPTLAFAQGKFAKGISSALISHTANEAKTFLSHIKDLDKFLAAFLPGDAMETIRARIKKQYNCALDPKKCVANIIRDATFTCNTRELFEAFPKQSYMMEYSYPEKNFAVHASDLIPLFANSLDEIKKILTTAKVPLPELGAEYIDKIRPNYQKYFATFALNKDPNPSQSKELPYWPKAVGGEKICQVMRVGKGLIPFAKNFFIECDETDKKTCCDFWRDIAHNIMNGGSESRANDENLQTQQSDELGEL